MELQLAFFFRRRTSNSRRRKLTVLVSIILASHLVLFGLQSVDGQSRPQINSVILPVPYYRTQYGCALATTRMILAYAVYPLPAPGEDYLFVSQAVLAGVWPERGPVAVPVERQAQLLRECGVNATFSWSWSFPMLRNSLRSGFPVTLVVKSTIIKETMEGTHAVLAIGFNATGIFIHDPSTKPCKYYPDGELRSYWEWEGNFWAVEAQVIPNQIPIYAVEASVDPPLSCVYIDGKRCDGLRSFVTGTSDRITVEPSFSFGNETTRIRYLCLQPTVEIAEWTARLVQVKFRYEVEVKYRVRITVPCENRSEDLWIRSGDRPIFSIEHLSRPVDGVEAYEGTWYRIAGVQNCMMRFLGWYLNGELVERSGTVEVTVSGPMTLEARWCEVPLLTMLVALAVAGLGVSALCFRERMPKAAGFNRKRSFMISAQMGPDLPP